MIYMIWLRISEWKWKRTVSVVSHESQSTLAGEMANILEGTEQKPWQARKTAEVPKERRVVEKGKNGKS